MAGVALSTNRIFPRVQPADAPGGDSLLAVEDIAALVALDDARVDDGGVVNVKSMLDLWMLDKSSALTPDGITVVAAPTSGNWVRLKLSNATWTQQSDWYIDPSGGDDENDGGIAAPLKTLSELARRWFDQIIDGKVTVHVLSSTPASDYPLFQFSIGVDGFVLFRGTPTTVATGTFTAVTNRNPAGNQPNEVTDTGLSADWGTLGYVGKLLRTTSGTNSGASAWVAKDLGSKKARVSSWLEDTTVDLPGLPGSYDYSPANCEIDVGDDYEVLDLPDIYDLSLVVTSLRSKPQPNEAAKFYMEDLSVNAAGDRNVIITAGLDRFDNYFSRCAFELVSPAPSHSLSLYGCKCNGWFSCPYGYVNLYAGMSTFYLGPGTFGTIVPARAVLANGGIYCPGGNIIVVGGGVCCMETGGWPGVWVEAGTFFSNSASAPVFGDADTGIGMVVGNGVVATYGPTKPTVTGTGGDAEVGGVAKTWAEIPFFNTANGAGIVA